MNNPRSSRLPLPALALVLLFVLPGCNDDSSPTEPPAPPVGPTITAASGATVPLAGTWRSACFTAPPGSPTLAVEETFVFFDSEIVITVAGFLTADCSGVTLSQELTVDYALGAESSATLAGQRVGVTRVDGTERDSGEPFLQILHVDDSGAHRLYHGALDDPPTDAEGYPVELFEEFLER